VLIEEIGTVTKNPHQNRMGDNQGTLVGSESFLEGSSKKRKSQRVGVVVIRAPQSAVQAAENSRRGSTPIEPVDTPPAKPGEATGDFKDVFSRSDKPDSPLTDQSVVNAIQIEWVSPPNIDV
jgi:hypothetical protein